ncbi:MAG: hypothetical protein AB8G11_24365 [Saprospiraceae bacterium]
MKKILFLFGFLVCSFGVFASNGIIETSISDDVSKMIEFIEDESPQLILIYIEGEGHFAYDDGNPHCVTYLKIDGHKVTVSAIVGDGCP